jgi:hypothetical protein
MQAGGEILRPFSCRLRPKGPIHCQPPGLHLVLAARDMRRKLVNRSLDFSNRAHGTKLNAKQGDRQIHPRVRVVAPSFDMDSNVSVGDGIVMDFVNTNFSVVL